MDKDKDRDKDNRKERNDDGRLVPEVGSVKEKQDPRSINRE